MRLMVLDGAVFARMGILDTPTPTTSSRSSRLLPSLLLMLMLRLPQIAVQGVRLLAVVRGPPPRKYLISPLPFPSSSSLFPPFSPSLPSGSSLSSLLVYPLSLLPPSSPYSSPTSSASPSFPSPSFLLSSSSPLSAPPPPPSSPLHALPPPSSCRPTAAFSRFFSLPPAARPSSGCNIPYGPFLLESPFL